MLIPSVAFAENLIQYMNKQVICGEYNNLEKAIENIYLEKKSLVIKQDNSENLIIIYYSDEFNSITILETDTKMACVLGVGKILNQNQENKKSNKDVTL